MGREGADGNLESKSLGCRGICCNGRKLVSVEGGDCSKQSNFDVSSLFFFRDLWNTPNRRTFSVCSLTAVVELLCQDLEVASVTTATGSDSSDSDSCEVNVYLQLRRSPWEAAVLRARVAAMCYKGTMGTTQASATQEPKEKKNPQMSAEEKYLAALSEQYSVRLAYALKAEPDRRFEKFRSEFFYQKASHFCGELQPLYNQVCGAWKLRPTPVSHSVQKKFLETLASKGEEKLMLVFHGTHENALGSIYSSGLLVPGKKKGVKVVNGACYGVGIYAGRDNNAAISWNYAKGGSRPLLVCAACDGTKEEVSHHGSFHVFKTDHNVVPLFEASVPAGSQARRPPPTLATRSYVRKRPIVPDAKKPKGPGPRTRIPQPQASGVVVFLSRRAANKRRGTSWCG